MRDSSLRKTARLDRPPPSLLSPTGKTEEAIGRGGWGSTGPTGQEEERQTTSVVAALLVWRCTSEDHPPSVTGDAV